MPGFGKAISLMRPLTPTYFQKWAFNLPDGLVFSFEGLANYLIALAILIFAVLAWLRRYWSLGGRIFYSLLALMALLLSWALVYWNLLL